MTEQEIRVRLERTDGREFLYSHDFSKNQADWSLKPFIADRLKITEAKIGNVLGELFFKSPFPYSENNRPEYKPTSEGAAQRVRHLLRDNSYSREWLFQLCIHLELKWYEAYDLFEEKLKIPFTNYGNLKEIVYEYSISQMYDIDCRQRLSFNINCRCRQTFERNNRERTETGSRKKLTTIAGSEKQIQRKIGCMYTPD